MTLTWKTLLLASLCLTQAAWATSHPETKMVKIPAGSYLPFFANSPAQERSKKRDPVQVDAFWLDPFPVTRAQYLEFVRSNPEWRKSRIKPIFSDGHYLENWPSDLSLKSPKDRERPVTFVSWFAAEAYCEWKDKELPSVDQWEYAASDNGRGSQEARQEILAWYGKPSSNPPAPVASSRKNGFGIHGLFGLVWEWTLDFNSASQGTEARDGGTKDAKLFCGGGSLGALDPTDYASFMRFSFRNSLKANYTIGNLGFRCAKEIDHD